jgi:hypothetical protein
MLSVTVQFVLLMIDDEYRIADVYNEENVLLLIKYEEFFIL